MALPDPKRMAATNMINRDSADPGKFLDLLTTLTSLGVKAFTGGAGDAAAAGAKAATKAVKKKPDPVEEEEVSESLEEATMPDPLRTRRRY